MAEATEQAPKKYLNVVIHGLYVIVQRPTIFEVILPNMQREHVYRAGEWLGETELEEGDYWLTGVKSPHTPQGPDPKENVLVSGYEPQPKEKTVHARIFLPLAEHVYSLRRVNVVDTIEANPSDLISSTTLSTVHVFRYEIENAQNVSLGRNHPIRRSLQRFKEGLFMSLHILSSPDRTERPDHVLNGFKAGVDILKGLSGKLSLRESSTVPPLSLDDVPPGLLYWELGSLAERTKRLGMLGRDIREELGFEQNQLNLLRDNSNSPVSIPGRSFFGICDQSTSCSSPGSQS